MAVYRDLSHSFLYSYILFCNLFIMDLFNLSPFAGHLGCFEFFVIINSAAMSPILLLLLFACAYLGYICRNWVAGPKSKCANNLGRYCQIPSVEALPVAIPPTVFESALVLGED